MKEEKRVCFQNRELSWLQFNERVLEEAEDENVPLCERLSFLSIFQSNLDEFFMVRVGSLRDQMLLSENTKDNKTNMTAQQQIEAILKRCKELGDKKDKIYEKLLQGLEKEGVHIINFQSLSKKEAVYLEQYFEREIAPLLSSIVVGKKQPFPFLKNKDIYAVAVLSTKNEKEKIGIIPCNTGVFERLIEIPSRKGSFMLAEELILHFLPKVFKSYKISAKSLIRITRNADIDAEQIYDEDLDYRQHMEEVVKRRRKLSPVRLEHTRELDGTTVAKLCEYMKLKKEQTFYSHAPIDLSFVSYIRDYLRAKSELFFDKRVPQTAAVFNRKQYMIEQIEKKDILLCYPYESMRPFLHLLSEAAVDPNVVSIKMTLYRLAKSSKIVSALIEAVESGKQVDVLVELKARFDEENNIEWSRRLEEAGCHVIYGLDDLKVHSKLCLITMKKEGKIEYITQIGTGNYNENTAKLYTDISLMTANPDIGQEASAVFQAIALGEVVENVEHLMVAPKCLQNKVIALIERETEKAKKGEEAYIGIKINSLTDKKIMNQLIKASRAGVKIDMIVRGICCLRSKIEGYTDNIRVISIVGRYLEHSRIYIFGKGKEEKMYISSADLMTRNTVRRLEVAVPIYDNDIKNRIRTMFHTMLQDNVKAREQMSDGKYQKVKKATIQLNSQEYFYEQAYDMAGNGLKRKEEQNQEYNIEEDIIIEDKEMAEVTEKLWEQATEALEEVSETIQTIQQQKYDRKAKRYRRRSRNRKK
ncbi:polyphosphate kinase 1 [Clostridium sp. MD294]|uniref:polyphosphate kinase 1 n=1 Tax=Clostridium sp. MD294 TaxID=97138 RepID=UPI0002CBB51B|nr:polyphosphate kinase 1 [Clostridium sp. MD294]NDO46925.1 polyphosphate kinase 1 [Clostridium sp. MD294]USF31411.1 Polyphosphate kinase [Clostridium sp. MD294]